MGGNIAFTDIQIKPESIDAILTNLRANFSHAHIRRASESGSDNYGNI